MPEERLGIPGTELWRRVSWEPNPGLQEQQVLSLNCGVIAPGPSHTSNLGVSAVLTSLALCLIYQAPAELIHSGPLRSTLSTSGPGARQER